MWLSLVERHVRDVEVASSNLVISTKNIEGALKHPLYFSPMLALFDIGCCSATTASSHTPFEDRQARLSDVERGYHEA